MNQNEILKTRGLYAFEFSKSIGIPWFRCSPHPAKKQKKRKSPVVEDFFMGAARNHLSREHCWECMPSVVAASWLALSEPVSPVCTIRQV